MITAKVVSVGLSTLKSINFYSGLFVPGRCINPVAILRQQNFGMGKHKRSVLREGSASYAPLSSLGRKSHYSKDSRCTDQARTVSTNGKLQAYRGSEDGHLPIRPCSLSRIRFSRILHGVQNKTGVCISGRTLKNCTAVYSVPYGNERVYGGYLGFKKR